MELFRDVNSAEELESHIKAGGLHEGSHFDAKRELPKKSEELAKDIAAMATYGGTLLFGVGEGASGEPTIPSPFDLDGAKERVSNVAHTAISPPVQLSLKAHKSSDGNGYLIATIPQSPFAPHMVTVRGRNRFYARNAEGNYPLTEPQIEALYQQRTVHLRAAKDRLETRLDGGGERGLVIVTSPIVERGDVALPAGDGAACRESLSSALKETSRVRASYANTFALPNWRDAENGYKVDDGARRLEVNWDLGLRFTDAEFVYSHAPLGGDKSDNHFNLTWLTAATLQSLLMASKLSELRGYIGQFDVGVRVLGLKGAYCAWAGEDSMPLPHVVSLAYEGSEFQGFHRTSVLSILEDPLPAACALLDRFVHSASKDYTITRNLATVSSPST